MQDRSNGTPNYTDEGKSSPLSSSDDFRPPPKESFRWYAYWLREFSKDWNERYPGDIIDDKTKPISKASRLMHNLGKKLENISEESGDILSIAEKTTNILSKLLYLERNLSNIPDDFASRLRKITKELGPLADSIEGLNN